jgi:hypothetical protein
MALNYHDVIHIHGKKFGDWQAYAPNDPITGNGDQVVFDVEMRKGQCVATSDCIFQQPPHTTTMAITSSAFSMRSSFGSIPKPETEKVECYT